LLVARPPRLSPLNDPCLVASSFHLASPQLASGKSAMQPLSDSACVGIFGLVFLPCFCKILSTQFVSVGALARLRWLHQTVSPGREGRVVL
jgi:hypothetical protein